MRCLGFLLQIPQVGFFQLPLCLFCSTIGAHLGRAVYLAECCFCPVLCLFGGLSSFHTHVIILILSLDKFPDNIPGCIPGMGREFLRRFLLFLKTEGEAHFLRGGLRGCICRPIFSLSLFPPSGLLPGCFHLLRSFHFIIKVKRHLGLLPTGDFPIRFVRPLCCLFGFPGGGTNRRILRQLLVCEFQAGLFSHVEPTSWGLVVMTW